MRYAMLVCAALGLGSLSPLPKAPYPELPKEPAEGLYKIKGSDGKSEYTGVATIRKAREIYLVNFTAWADGTANTTTTGVGQWRDGRLSVGWSADAGTKNIGVTVYRRHNNDLIGTWAVMPSPGLIRTEELVWIGKLKDD